ncbi:MAG TPA: adenylate cyclase, partial [Cyanobacteria bacterium UBA8553]|nr:adenylate cyclase [Cyanobacteria bacterium UBA8553]
MYELGFGINKIGREKDNRIVVLDGSLSRYHAEITINGDRIILTDRQSLNGTFVNNHRIESCQLKDGDIIRFGSVAFKFVNAPVKSPDDEASEPSVVRQVSPEATRITIQSALQLNSTSNSV